MANSDEKAVAHLNGRLCRFEIRRNDKISSSRFFHQVRSNNSSQNYALNPKTDESCILGSQPFDTKLSKWLQHNSEF